MLDHIAITLVEPTHPGNIGSSARAMKTMGLSKLCLVNPMDYPSMKAYALASGALDVLDQARVVDTLSDALDETHLVIGASARKRDIQVPLLDIDDLGREALACAAKGKKVSLLFGREHSGLTNEELYRCHYQVTIPSNPVYSSLNLSQAVQIFCYEIRKQFLKDEPKETSRAYEQLAKAADVERFYQHFEAMLYRTEFITADTPKKLMPKIKRMFSRIQLEETEVNFLRGILTAIDKSIENNTKECV